MNLETFKYLPKEERERHIRDHRHFLGEREQCYIGYGKAVLDFFKGYLKVDITIPEDILTRLQEENYRHCYVCGCLFEGGFGEENKIGFLSKTLGFILDPFNISSSECDSCFEKRKQKK